jgi:RNA polymerase sigma-70 factor (ECF subfamily)
VLQARDPRSPEAREALEQLCGAYWFPLYAFVRRKGHPPEEAEDLLQEFFVRLVEKNYVAQADRERGLFRSFLLAALAHFLANDWHRQQTLKRGGGQAWIPWDARGAEQQYSREPCHELTPEKLFDRRWALGMVERTYATLREQYAAAGKAELFRHLEPRLSGDDAPASYKQLAARLQLTEGAIKVTVHRLRRAFGQLLREEVAHTVARPEQVQDEMRHLLDILRE